MNTLNMRVARMITVETVKVQRALECNIIRYL